MRGGVAGWSCGAIGSADRSDLLCMGRRGRLELLGTRAARPAGAAGQERRGWLELRGQGKRGRSEQAWGAAVARARGKQRQATVAQAHSKQRLQRATSATAQDSDGRSAEGKLGVPYVMWLFV